MLGLKQSTPSLEDQQVEVQVAVWPPGPGGTTKQAPRFNRAPTPLPLPLILLSTKQCPRKQVSPLLYYLESGRLGKYSMVVQYLFVFAQVHDEFRIPEIQSIAELHGFQVFFPPPVDVSRPFQIVELEDESHARILARRCILVK